MAQPSRPCSPAGRSTTTSCGTLGTLPNQRGRGLGTLLLRTSFAQFHARGFNRVTLGVDAQNETGAVNLYKAAGMHPTKTWLCYALPTT